nr:hypothetical protein CFP56_45780 [Quercus suber]
MSSRGTSRGLSFEDKAELARSNKKVKDIHHANFMKDNANREEFSWGKGHANHQLSFKDKLVGELPGAYRRAFDLMDQMEAFPEVERDTPGLRKGLAVVRIFDELKQKIRAPWARALIVKVYGRTMGFNFLQQKLSAL